MSQRLRQKGRSVPVDARCGGIGTHPYMKAIFLHRLEQFVLNSCRRTAMYTW
jgi:hypothetical protein